MKETSKIMYKIGRIVNFVLMGLHGILFIVNLIWMIVDFSNGNTIGGSSHLGSMITNLIFIALCVVLFFLDRKYMPEIEQGTKEQLPYIMLIIFGVLASGNVLYVLGSIFGLIAMNQDNDSGENKKEEEHE